MQPSPSPLARPAPGLPADVLERLGPAPAGSEPDVVLALGNADPPQRESARMALVAIGEPGDAWLEEEVDHQVTPAELHADPKSVVRVAWARRLAFRPHASDTVDDWLASVRSLSGADGAMFVADSGATTRAGDTDALEALAEPSSTLIRAARHRMVVAADPDDLEHRLELGRAPVHGVIACPTGDGVLIVGVGSAPAPAAGWPRQAASVVRQAAAAADRRARAQRTASLEADNRRLDQLVRRMLSLLNHDLRNALFPVQLGVKILERQHGSSPQIAALARSAASAVDLVRRAFEAGWSLLDPSKVTPGTAELDEVWSALVATAHTNHPQRQIVGVLPKIRIGLDATVVDKLLSTLLDNALGHGPADAPISVGWQVDGPQARVWIRNPGKLPFTDLERIEPFEHRSGGGLGVGLYIARRLARAHGASLTVRQLDGEVEAVLELPVLT